MMSQTRVYYGYTVKQCKLKIQYYDILHWSLIPVDKYALSSYLHLSLQINEM